MDEELATSAIAYIKQNKKLLYESFCDLTSFPPSERPFTFFMAGSPGAGKTEVSKALIKQLNATNSDSKIVRIDADEVRNILPQYKGANAHLVQGAASIGVEKLIDHVMNKNQNAIIDGTFAHYPTSRKNIERSLVHNRQVEIYYIYQDPKIAWDFTRKREKLEGRNIRKDDFIYAFFSAQENVNKAKEEFGKQITLNLIIKDIRNNIDKTKLNIDRVDHHLSTEYNKDILKDILI